MYITPVAKSIGSILVGDLVIFTYLPDDRKRYNFAQRIAVVVKPVIRDAKTGNFLLTVVKVAIDGSSRLKSLVTYIRISVVYPKTHIGHTSCLTLRVISLELIQKRGIINYVTSISTRTRDRSVG